MRQALDACPGIRILHQEPWEAICSFIISQNNHIPRIKGIIGRLCESFGEPLGSGDFAFPSPERLAVLDISALAPLRAGFRAGYLLDAAKKIATGEVSLEALSILPLEEARASLQKIRGVGPKVAECALLYGCGRMDAFPIDVWMKRVMAECYPQGLPACIQGYEGIAQHIYLSGDESDHILVKKGLLQNISSCSSPFFTFFRENSDRLQRASGVSDKSIGSLETVSREKIFRKLARISAVCRLKIASSLDAAKSVAAANKSSIRSRHS